MNRGAATPRHLATAVLLCCCLGLGFLRLGIDDLYWHVVTGRQILSTGALLDTEVFSYTLEGRPVGIHSPLFQLLVATMEAFAGLPGLQLLHAGLLFLLALLLRRSLMAHGWGNLQAPALVLLVLVLSRPQLGLHPQLFQAFGLVLFLALRRDGHLPWPRALFVASAAGTFAWGLFHPSYPLALALAALLFLDLPHRPRVAAESLFALAAGLLCALLGLAAVHPSILTNVYHHLDAEVMRNLVGYWQPLLPSALADSHGLATLLALLLLGVPAAFAPWYSEKGSRRWTGTVLLVLCFTMTFYGLRFYPLALLAAAMLLPCPSWFQCSRPWREVLLWTTTSLAVVATWYGTPLRPGLGLDRALVPVNAVERLPELCPKVRLFNAYNYGGYLLYRIWPEYQVFIDPRSSQVYPDAFLAEFSRCYRDPGFFEELAAQWEIRCTLLPARSPVSQLLLGHLDKSGHWERVYRDEVAILHRRLEPPQRVSNQ